jgi:hypothetical protein
LSYHIGRSITFYDGLSDACDFLSEKFRELSEHLKEE